MRRIAPLLLTALVLINLLGFYVVFIIEQQQIRVEMNEQANTLAAHQTFNYNTTQFAQLNWTVAGKEFNLNGQLYDIISIKKLGSRIELTVASDKDEMELVNSFLSLFSQQHDNEQNQSPLKTFLTHFQQDYVALGHQLSYIITYAVSGTYLFNQACAPASYIAGNVTPPPQFFTA